MKWEFRAWLVACAFALLAASSPAPAQPNDPPGEQAGGTGIVFNTESGRPVVHQLIPGSPGDEAGVPIGAVLLEIDGDPVRRMSREEMIDRVRGRVGSRVRLLLEIEGEEVEFRLRRSDISRLISPDQPAPTQDEPEGDRPSTRRSPDEDRDGRSRGGEPVDRALRDFADTIGELQVALGLDADDLASLSPPDWVRPGRRLTYETGYSASSNWLNDMQSGEDDDATGHMTIAACDITAVAGGIALVVRSDYNWDPNQRVFTAALNPYSYAGPAASMCDLWVPPEVLETVESRTMRSVYRGPYELNGRRYDVVRLRVRTDGRVTHWMFDAETGMLLVYRSFDRVGYEDGGADDVAASLLEFESSAGQYLVFRGSREIDWPWSEGGIPDWVERGTTMTFQGNNFSVLEGQGTFVGSEYASRFEFTHVSDDMAAGTLSVLPTPSNPQPLDQPMFRGMAMTGLVTNLFLPDGAFRRLRAGQLIDRDPFTGVEVAVVAKDGERVTLEHRHPNFFQRYVFDRDGRLQQVENFIRQSTGGQGWVLNLSRIE